MNTNVLFLYNLEIWPKTVLQKLIAYKCVYNLYDVTSLCAPNYQIMKKKIALNSSKSIKISELFKWLIIGKKNNLLNAFF